MNLLVTIDDINKFDIVLACYSDWLVSQHWNNFTTGMNLAYTVDSTHY